MLQPSVLLIIIKPIPNNKHMRDNKPSKIDPQLDFLIPSTGLITQSKDFDIFNTVLIALLRESIQSPPAVNDVFDD